jgi:polysaccharide chain length determinant protein (PEP-CTERM system associated)
MPPSSFERRRRSRVAGQAGGIVVPRWQQIVDEARGAWRYRWLSLAVAAALALIGWLAVFALPDRYEASAEVLVDSRTALTPALQGLAVEQDVGVQLNYVREALLAEPQLLKLAQDAGVLPDHADAVTQERTLASLRKRVWLIVQGPDDRNTGTTYRILFQDTDRDRALRVVSILLDTFVNETLGGKRRNSDNAQQFLESQVQDYEKRLRTSEDKLAEFKSRHLGLMPGEQGEGGYFAQLQKDNDEVEALRTKLLSAESRRGALEDELHGDAAVTAASAQVPVAKNGGVGGGNDTVSRIAETQAHLDELLLRFTDQHPDVIATRQALAELKARRAAELESLRNGDPGAIAASGASANPVYQGIQTALNQTNVEISDLRTELARHEAKAKELKQLLGTAPQIEAEYAQLTRDYAVNKEQYTALLSNLEKARVGGRADEAGSVRFEVVQPPLAPVLPVSPRRGQLLAGILLGSLVLGGALGYRLDRMHPLIISANNVTKLAGVPVIGVFGTAFPAQARRRKRSQVLAVALAMACLVAAFGAAVWLSHTGARLNIPPALRHLVRL